MDEVIGEASPEDFQLLTSTFSERALTHEDLGAEPATSRPDLVPIMIRSGVGWVPRMTRRKLFSGRLRRSRPRR
ncbi:hypothetical protein DCD74_07100 [Lysobacter oculi]|uniref:Uncharacterized protein n=1 Tax=Solilutibacter oculi TaxID=2698682 RepID=A0A344J621_9GAMM|nr:hypothetical protein DCD74_07100 [Lysobacter oculi]